MQTDLEFIVGEEKLITDIISSAEIEPLLRSLVMAGLRYAAVLDENNHPLCHQGNKDEAPETTHLVRHHLHVEGEPKGTLLAACGEGSTTQFKALALLARDALQLIINNNLKRMLTTEIHTSVVQESYDQLVETNKRLSVSEKSYRELALSLEQKVEERTAELQKAYARMLQQEKLAAVGSLAAGMAHEINNPNGFVRSNLTTFDKYFQRMKEMLNRYQLLIANNTPLNQLYEDTERRRRELKLDFICGDAAELLKQSIEGTDRIARIVADLKSFSHVDESGSSDINLNDELERTLAVLGPQIAEDTVVERNFQPLPQYGCNPGLMSQAFFNIIHNALLSRAKGLVLKIATQFSDGEVVVDISDNGSGIPAENRSRVFEPFFTTRGVGSGTGMGLTVAREIIGSAGGTVEIMSSELSGTTATIRLPLAAGKR